MRRTVLPSVLFGLVAGVGLLAAPAVPAAQEASPTAGAAPIALESLGSVAASDAPGR